MELLNLESSNMNAIFEAIINFPWLRIGIVFIFFYGVLCLFAFLFTDKILFPAPATPTYNQETSLFFLDTRCGLKIACRIWKNSDSSKGTILYSHGNAEDLGMIDEYLVPWIEDGYRIVSYDYPGYGQSWGKPTEEGCYSAIDAVYSHLTKSMRIDPEKIVIWGRSLGTGPSCYLASRENVAGLLLETPFLSAFLTVSEIPIIPWDRFSSYKKASLIHCPLLVIHGKHDEIIPFRHGKRLYELFQSPKQFLEVPEATHNNLPQAGGTKYRNAISCFLQDVLKN